MLLSSALGNGYHHYIESHRWPLYLVELYGAPALLWMIAPDGGKKNLWKAPKPKKLQCLISLRCGILRHLLHLRHRLWKWAGPHCRNPSLTHLLLTVEYAHSQPKRTWKNLFKTGIQQNTEQIRCVTLTMYGFMLSLVTAKISLMWLVERASATWATEG